MDLEKIREFARRDRAGLEDSKRRHWATEHRSGGPARTLGASLGLWLHMRRVRPDWPTPRDRAEDLRHHLDLKLKFDRAARAFARR